MIAVSLWFPSTMALSHKLREVKNFLRNVFARETLEEAPPLRPPATPRRQFVASVFGREPLAVEEELPEPARRVRFLASLFSREQLPQDPPASPRPAHPGFLRALFAPEPLPQLPVAPPRAGRARWLRWLFGLERLDPP